MNILKAYDEIWFSLKNLAKDGVTFTITPSHSREIEETLRKFRSQPDRLPEHLWSHVEFSVESDWVLAALRREEVRLSSLNIAFDTSGGGGTKCWELDWSVFIASDERIYEMEYTRKILNDVVDSIESDQND